MMSFVNQEVIKKQEMRQSTKSHSSSRMLKSSYNNDCQRMPHFISKESPSPLVWLSHYIYTSPCKRFKAQNNL